MLRNISYRENHKQEIARCFNRAASNYDFFSSFQRRCGEKLYSNLHSIRGKVLLDAGCGTGWFSKMWKKKEKFVIALDISEKMLTVAKKNQSANFYVLGDIEKLPLASTSLDIIFSNLVLQWCDSLSRALSEFYRALKPGGIIAVSTLVNGSLIELNSAWRKIDNKNHVNPFLSKSEVYSAFSPYRHFLKIERKILYYSKLIDLLREIKGVGASYLYETRRPGLLTPSYLKRVESYWTKTGEKLPLSYKVAYGVIYYE